MLISLFMTDHSQAMQLSYYIIIVSSEMHVQLESSAHFIEIHPILTVVAIGQCLQYYFYSICKYMFSVHNTQ